VRRKQYHRIEDILGAPRRLVGRMADFEVTPTALRPEMLLTTIEMMQRP